MVSVPQRLLDLPFVDCLYADDDLVVLRKRVTAALHERPTYVAMHALTLVQEGQQILYDETGKRLRVGPGQAGLMRRGLYGVTDLVAPASGAFATVVVFFSDRLLRDASASAPGPDPGMDLCLFPAGGAVQDWVGTLPQNLSAEPSPGAAEAYRQGFRTLLDRLSTEGGEAVRATLGGLLRTRRRPLREFMRAHYDKPLTLLDYAVLSGRSERSFRRDFKTRFGESPKRWLVARRLERARELLAAGETRVQVLAQAVGYRSASHFIELYKDKYGTTPGVDIGKARLPPVVEPTLEKPPEAVEEVPEPGR